MTTQADDSVANGDELLLTSQNRLSALVRSTVTGQSPHVVNKMLDAMIVLGLVFEVNGRKHNRIYEYNAYLELPNRES